VKHISQTRGIVDLMLSKATKQHRANQLTHLVAYFGERDHGFRLNVISESGGR